MIPISEQFILVTGATDGIGKLTASRLARLGANVLIHGRDADKCRAVRDKMRETEDNPKIDFFVADFSSLSNVRQMAAELRESHENLDVLINNAGVLPSSAEYGNRPFSKEGFDLCFTVNYLAPFLLTHLLLPALRTSSAARIINVTSAAWETIDLDDLLLFHNYSPMRAYARSKLALAMFTFELSARLMGEQVTVNCLHPGNLLDTKMVRQAFSRSMGKAESGAEAEVYLATAPELEGISGAYYDQKRRDRYHEQVYDAQARQKLWQASLELTDLVTRLDV